MPPMPSMPDQANTDGYKKERRYQSHATATTAASGAACAMHVGEQGPDAECAEESRE